MILFQARRANRENDITGLLVFSDDHFLQVLEGSSHSLSETLARISSDRRHHDLHLFDEEWVDTRLFQSWTMGYCAIQKRPPLHQRYLELLASEPEDRRLAPLLPALRTYYEACRMDPRLSMVSRMATEMTIVTSA